MSDIKKLTDKIKIFCEERDWIQFHNHKDMAISLCLEAAEVLEHFQWKTEEEIEKYVLESKNEIAEELADVAIYLFELADNLKIDLSESIDKKIEKNAVKYPINKVRGKHTKYDKL
jgi:NTP pyrophosphatase (non-canonical NTP hydrolase)